MTASPDNDQAAGPDEELMTRAQVARRFRVTSAAVAAWARSGRLPEVRKDGRPRYRPADVDALFRARRSRGVTVRIAAGSQPLDTGGAGPAPAARRATAAAPGEMAGGR
jgi:DNA-binding transcriptional MerR regulator